MVCSNRVLPCTFSHHDFVCLDLGAFSTWRSGIWKFNAKLLKDPEFRQSISSLVSDQKSKMSLFDTLGDSWDNLKILIRKFCVDFSARKWQAHNRSRSLLTKELICAKRDFHTGATSDDSTIKYLQNALSALVLQEAEGVKIRSRAQWIEEGEKLSLTDLERDSCEGIITTEELFVALKGLQTGKAPGSDGLPAEFYLAFWDDLGDSLCRVLNERFCLGILTESQRGSLLLGFGSSFISWLNLFYHRVQSAVNVNGYLSPFFNLSRGVRQGCPLSPLLYVLVSEVLAVNIQSNSRISGLCHPGLPALSPISQYSIAASLEVYSLFEKVSGCKLNLSKSKGLWLSGWSGRNDPPVALDWTSAKIKVLGVFIGPGNLEQDNWRTRITAVDNVLKSWRARSLSFRGKSLVINALALSEIWYGASLGPERAVFFGLLLLLE